ncbi:hypothetical protein ACLQ24_27835, partial [Micromonospora sp. DT4]
MKGPTPTVNVRRAQIDEIDQALIDLIKRRRALSELVQSERMQNGGTRMDLGPVLWIMVGGVGTSRVSGVLPER